MTRRGKEIRKFKVGDKVTYSSIYPGKPRDPLETMTVRGHRYNDPEVIRVERISKRTGDPYFSWFHQDFLEAVER